MHTRDERFECMYNRGSVSIIFNFADGDVLINYSMKNNPLSTCMHGIGPRGIIKNFGSSSYSIILKNINARKVINVLRKRSFFLGVILQNLG